jgi:hypothetical protein
VPNAPIASDLVGIPRPEPTTLGLVHPARKAFGNGPGRALVFLAS